MLVGNYCCIFILNIYQVLNHIKILKDLIDIKMKGYLIWRSERREEWTKRGEEKKIKGREKKKDKLLIKWNNEIKINFFFSLYFNSPVFVPLHSLASHFFLPKVYSLVLITSIFMTKKRIYITRSKSDA